MLWHRIREHPFFRRSPTTTEGLKEAVRGLLAEEKAETAIRQQAETVFQLPEATECYRKNLKDRAYVGGDLR